MRILVTGANGFIAGAIIRQLLSAGHHIIACARSHPYWQQENPHVTPVRCDFTRDITTEVWLPRLADVDCVVNCVGVFHTAKANTIWQIHTHAPKALFNACIEAEVKQVIQISALGVDKVAVPYCQSKLAADEHLQSLALNSVIIRPSFVYGRDCYGGSAFFRGLAAIPIVQCLPGKAEQKLQPIDIETLALIVEKSLTLKGKHCLNAAGSEQLSLKAILLRYRQWLGFKAAITLTIPLSWIRLTAKVGDWLHNSPISTTGLKLSAIDNTITADEQKTLHETTGVTPAGFSETLANQPSGVQDRWHARLFFLRLLLRFCIAFIWIFTGLVSLLTSHHTSLQWLSHMPIPHTWLPLCLYGASIIDIGLGLATLFNYRLALVGSLQCLMMVFYTLMISLFLPTLWLNPFGPISKNIPLLIATLIMMALEKNR